MIFFLTLYILHLKDTFRNPLSTPQDFKSKNTTTTRTPTFSDKTRSTAKEEATKIITKTLVETSINWIKSLWDYYTKPTEETKPAEEATSKKEEQTSEEKTISEQTNPQPSTSNESNSMGVSLSGESCKTETYFFIPPGCTQRLCIVKQSCGENSLEAICPSKQCTSLNPEERMQNCTSDPTVSFVGTSKTTAPKETKKK